MGYTLKRCLFLTGFGKRANAQKFAYGVGLADSELQGIVSDFVGGSAANAGVLRLHREDMTGGRGRMWGGPFCKKVLPTPSPRMYMYAVICLSLQQGKTNHSQQIAFFKRG